MKNKLVVYGNCQAGVLSEFLYRTPALRDEFEVRHHFVHFDVADLPGRAADMAEAAIVLVQDVSDWARYELRDHIPASALRIDYPFVHAACMWPFDCALNPEDTVAKAHPNPTTAFAYHDTVLGQIRGSVPDPERRFVAYKGLSWPGLDDLKDLQAYRARTDARLRRVDSRFDLSVGEFLLAHRAERRLFHTITHPTGEFLALMASQLLAKAGLAVEPDEVTDSLAEYQVPIHPAVRDGLGLEWLAEDSIYNFPATPGFTFDEYYRRYISTYG